MQNCQTCKKFNENDSNWTKTVKTKVQMYKNIQTSVDFTYENERVKKIKQKHGI